MLEPPVRKGQGRLQHVPGGCQTEFRSIADDYDFALYLIDNDLKRDALRLVSSPCFTPSDTLTFLRGWAHYNLKQLPQAREYFQGIPKGSSFYDQSLFYSTAVSAHLGDFSTPVASLTGYDGPYTELRDLQLSGLALLRDDPAAFKQASQGFGFSDFALQEAEHTLCDIYNSRYVKRAKSPALAAIASAIIPGSGKIYAGKLGEGISAFLLTGVFGAITAEHWVKDGPANWKTIVPGLLGAFLYIGNIYGSYMSVSIYNSNLKDAQDTAVLYNIHIPLRSVFK
jgi:TM2 domain-containing membrane protein YozV